MNTQSNTALPRLKMYTGYRVRLKYRTRAVAVVRFGNSSDQPLGSNNVPWSATSSRSPIEAGDETTCRERSCARESAARDVFTAGFKPRPST
jgi:hypothetical protein